MRCPWVPAMFLLLLGPALAPAQQIRGVVGDVTTSDRLQGTLLVMLDAGGAIRATTLADSAGAFHLDVPANDSLRLYVQHVGYTPHQTVPLALGPADTLELLVGMRPDPLELEGIIVAGTVNRNLERFLRNERRGFGHFLGPQQIARMDVTKASQLLTRVPGGMLTQGATEGIVAVRRPEGMNAAGLCTPTVFVDGSRVEPAMARRGGQVSVPVDSYVARGSVRAVEVYRNPASAPSEYQRPFMDTCSVVVIWTDYGFGFGRYR